MFGKVKLVHQRPQSPRVNPPAWGDQAGSDFDDQAHGLSFNVTSQSLSGTRIF